MDNQADKGTDITTQAIYSLASYVRGCYSDAQHAKTNITARLLKCERQRRGEYEPEVLAQIREQGGTEIFMMLTDIKCRAAESWIKDVMMSAGEGPSFSVSPTTEPNLPPELIQEVQATVMLEQQMLQMQGMPVPPEAVQIRMEEMAEQIQQELKTRATTACEGMERRIRDAMEEAEWEKKFGDVVDDFVTFPTAIIKGPVINKKVELAWGPNFTPMVTEQRKANFKRVSPYNIFPSPGSTGPQSGSLIERHPLERHELQAMLGCPGYNDNEIKRCLDQYDQGNSREWLYGDTEKDTLDGKNSIFYQRGRMEALEFWGRVSGKMLIEWGMQKNIDPYRDYEANVWLVGPYVIRAVLNSNPLGLRPYSTASFVRIPDSFWGKALPELMSDVQEMCNSAARSLKNNMAMASGPMAEVTIDRLAEGEKVTQIYPWRQFQTTSDKTGGGQPAIRFFQPNMNVEALLAVYNTFNKQADEVTGVPNYIYGSTAVSGAGRTASGLAMLMENAAKGIKHAIIYLDEAVSAVVYRQFLHLMLYDPDMSIKADAHIVPSGVVATLIKGSVQERRERFLAATANPIDLQIMGLKGRGAVLRETAKDLEIDVDDVVPDLKALERMQMLQMAQQQQQMQQQQQQQPQKRVGIQRDGNGAIQGMEVLQ
jgi:hypothetical protein